MTTLSLQNFILVEIAHIGETSYYLMKSASRSMVPTDGTLLGDKLRCRLRFARQDSWGVLGS